jgi:hypothetical protein
MTTRAEQIKKIDRWIDSLYDVMSSSHWGSHRYEEAENMIADLRMKKVKLEMEQGGPDE